MATIRQRKGETSGAVTRKIKATNVVPSVCPNRRAVPCIPLAPPLREVGAEEMIVTLLGVWNNPNPAPQTAILQIIWLFSGWGGSSASRNKPNANTAIPTPPSSPGWIFSTSLPANGAATIVAKGHGVSSNPVSATLRPNTPSNKKGNDTIANICAVKEHTDVPIESEKMGIFSRSTGRIGA